MTTASALVALNQDIVNARTAITNKGGTVTSGGGSYQLATDIATIPSGGSAPVITSLNVTPTTSAQTITAPSGTDGYSPVNVAAVTAAIDSNIQAGNIKKDVTILNVTGTYEGGSTPTGRYQLLDRVKDDNNNEIGTVSGFFTDANDVEYAVVCLDAQYRLNSGQWCSNASTVTNMPMYNSMQSSNIWTAKETATQNTQWILDYCSTKGYRSGCTHCRNQSFVIGGITYYGQLPNILELIDIAKLYNEYNSLWSSSQYGTTAGYMVQNNGTIGSIYKTNSASIFPVIEIPNAL